MGDTKRYYWLRFKEDFFTSKRIKKLRKISADCVIIYLKMQLKALKTDGYLEITGIEDSIADEIALDIDEDSDKVQPDGIHPNDKGVRKMADIIAEALKQ